MSSIIDITRPLSRTIATWPGDSPFNLDPTLKIESGASVNLTTLTMSAHTGTHMDAPYHFHQEGDRVDELDLLPYWGLAQVVTATKPIGPLYPANFEHVDLSLAPRLLVHSQSSHRDLAVFDQEIVYPSPELAQILGEAGIILYGSDAPSMDAVDDEKMPGHNALYNNKIMILEGLDLSKSCAGGLEEGCRVVYLFRQISFTLALASTP